MASKNPKQIYNKNAVDSTYYERTCTLTYRGQEITGTRIPNRVFVGGIPPLATEYDLNQLFSKYGPVKSAKIVFDKCGVSKGYGFITYETTEGVIRLRQDENNLILKDRKLNIAPAIQKYPPYEFDRVDSPPAYGSASSNMSNMYFANLVYHDGMTFTSQHYQSPLLLSSSPATQPLPVMYGSSATAPAYGPTIFYPIPNPVSVAFVGNPNFPYQSLSTVPNNQPSTEILYTSALPALSTAALTSVPPPPIPATSAAVQQHNTPPALPPPISSTTAAMVSMKNNTTYSVPITGTADQAMIDAHAHTNYTVSNADLTAHHYFQPTAAPMLPHVIVNSSALNSIPPQNGDYGIPPDMYPIVALNHHPGMYQYCDVSASTMSNVSSEEGSYESHQNGYPSHEMMHYTTSTASGQPNINHNPPITTTVVQQNVRADSYSQMKPANFASSPAINNNNNSNTNNNYNKQEMMPVWEALPIEDSRQQMMSTTARYAAIPSSTEYRQSSSYNQVTTDYSSSSLIQNVAATSVVYPVTDNPSNIFINSICLGSHHHIPQLQYSNYTRNDNIPYANDRPPKYESRNNINNNKKSKYGNSKDEPPNIPKFPFSLNTGNYQSGGGMSQGYLQQYGYNTRSYKTGGGYKSRNNNYYNNNNYYGSKNDDSGNFKNNDDDEKEKIIRKDDYEDDAASNAKNDNINIDDDDNADTDITKNDVVKEVSVDNAETSEEEIIDESVVGKCEEKEIGYDEDKWEDSVDANASTIANANENVKSVDKAEIYSDHDDKNVGNDNEVKNDDSNANSGTNVGTPAASTLSVSANDKSNNDSVVVSNTYHPRSYNHQQNQNNGKNYEQYEAYRHNNYYARGGRNYHHQFHHQSYNNRYVPNLSVRPSYQPGPPLGYQGQHNPHVFYQSQRGGYGGCRGKYNFDYNQKRYIAQGSNGRQRFPKYGRNNSDEGSRMMPNITPPSSMIEPKQIVTRPPPALHQSPPSGSPPTNRNDISGQFQSLSIT